MFLPIPLDINLIATVLSAIFGGGGLKVFERFLSRRHENEEEASRLRGELREQIKVLQLNYDDEKSESERWQSLYWEEKEKNVKLLSEIESLRNQLQEYLTNSGENTTQPTGGNTDEETDSSTTQQ